MVPIPEVPDGATAATSPTRAPLAKPTTSTRPSTEPARAPSSRTRRPATRWPATRDRPPAVARTLPPVTDTSAAVQHAGRLMQLLTARGGAEPGAPTMVIQHREALIYTLRKAAELAQPRLCQYL